MRQNESKIALSLFIYIYGNNQRFLIEDLCEQWKINIMEHYVTSHT